MRPHLLIHSHPRLSASLIFGAAVVFALPGEWGWISRALVGWNCAIWSYISLMAWLVTNCDDRRMQKLASQENENGMLVLVIMSLGAVLSIAAIVLELSSLKNATNSIKVLHYGLTVATILGSWLLIGVIYTFHYAHLFYQAPAQKKPLHFPEELVTPGYWDFLYFSITISMTAQTSDVNIMSASMRKTVLAQAVLSFLFNVAIIGMTINIAASIIGG